MTENLRRTVPGPLDGLENGIHSSSFEASAHLKEKPDALSCLLFLACCPRWKSKSRQKSIKQSYIRVFLPYTCCEDIPPNKKRPQPRWPRCAHRPTRSCWCRKCPCAPSCLSSPDRRHFTEIFFGGHRGLSFRDGAFCLWPLTGIQKENHHFGGSPSLYTSAFAATLSGSRGTDSPGPNRDICWAKTCARDGPSRQEDTDSARRLCPALRSCGNSGTHARIPGQDCHFCLTEARCAPLGKCRAVPLTTVPEKHQSRMINGQPSPAMSWFPCLGATWMVSGVCLPMGELPLLWDFTPRRPQQARNPGSKCRRCHRTGPASDRHSDICTWITSCCERTNDVPVARWCVPAFQGLHPSQLVCTRKIRPRR